MSEICLYPKLLLANRSTSRTIFKFEEAQPPLYGCYYSRVERMMGMEGMCYKFLVTLSVIHRGKIKKVKAPPIKQVLLDENGLLSFVCGDITPDEQFTVNIIDIQDDEGFVLLPLSWSLRPLVINPDDTLKVTFGIMSEKFLMPTNLWDENIVIDLNGLSIHMSR